MVPRRGMTLWAGYVSSSVDCNPYPTFCPYVDIDRRRTESVLFIPRPSCARSSLPWTAVSRAGGTRRPVVVLDDAVLAAFGVLVPRRSSCSTPCAYLDGSIPARWRALVRAGRSSQTPSLALDVHATLSSSGEDVSAARAERRGVCIRRSRALDRARGVSGRGAGFPLEATSRRPSATIPLFHALLAAPAGGAAPWRSSRSRAARRLRTASRPERCRS